MIIGGVIAYLTFGSQGVSAEEIRNDALGAMEDAKTVQMEMSLNVETPGMSMKPLTMSGALDRENKRMRATISLIPPVPVGGRSEDFKIYFVENTVYMNTGAIFQNMGGTLPNNAGIQLENMPSWIKYKVPSWNPQNKVGMKKELLDRSQVERLQDEGVDGVECYVLKIKPTEEYWNYVENMFRSGELTDYISTMSTSVAPSTENIVDAFENVQEMFENISVKGWYSKETGYPLKNQFKTDIDIGNILPSMDNMENIPSYPDELTVGITINMKFHGYNEPVSIELPEEASKAMDFADLGNMVLPGKSYNENSYDTL